MARARIAAVAALVLVLLLAATAAAAPGAVRPTGVAAQAAVAWSTSSGLLVAEVVTGGASASDEYVELTNASATAVDLAGHEVAYVTSSGSTVTRKASWSAPLFLEPGRHLLIANGSGIYATAADAIYSGGFAATGGSIVVRPIGGEPVDAVAWGDATSAYVEGSAAPAPAAGSSIERRPGGPLGSSVDTNENAADFVIHAAPVAQNLAAAPVPSTSPSAVPSASPTPAASSTASPGSTPSPSPASTPTPTPAATPTTTPATSPSSIPSSSPSPTPHPTASPAPSSSPGPMPSPTASPAPSTAPISIAAARLGPIGTTVLVRGVVVAEAGRLGTPPLLAIADATGGIPVKLPDGVAPPVRGALLEVRAVLADPYGQAELRPATGGITVAGAGTPPAPVALHAGAIGEANEGRLARVTGTIDGQAAKSTSNDLTFSIKGTDGAPLRILADASAGLDASLFRMGAGVSLTGIVGQRASRKGALDGYRLWLRDRADVVITAAPAPTPSPTPRSGPTPRPGNGGQKPPAMSVRAALVHAGQRVTVEGILTVGTSLLDGSGRRTIVEDNAAAIEVYLAAPDASMRLGTRVRVTGTVGEAWGAPRLRAEEARVLGSRKPAVHGLKTAPTAAVEWRLVRVAGTVVEVHKSGDRWTAELQIHGGRVPIAGLSGSGISSTDLFVGRTATITGIVKRPYPTATDRRFAIVPRQRSDIVLGVAPAAGASAAPNAGSAAGYPGTPGTPASSGAAGGIGGPDSVPAGDIDLRDLAAHAGERVRVGGLVAAIEAGGVRLDDGTAEALIVLGGDAAGLTASLQVGDALNATGTPEIRDEPVLVVDDAAGIELVGDLAGAVVPSDAGPSVEAATIASDGEQPAAPVRAAFAAGLGLDSVWTGLGTLVLVGVASVGVTLARREHGRRLLRARIGARLEALGRGAPASSAPTSAAGPTPDLVPDRPADQPPAAAIRAQTGVELGANVRGSA